MTGKTQIKGLVWCPERVKAGGLRHVARGHRADRPRHVRTRWPLRRLRAVFGRAGLRGVRSRPCGPRQERVRPEGMGCLPAEGGKDILIDDVHELRKTVAARYARQTPYFLFGHSMGSFVTRAYLARHAEGLAGAVLCGTGNQSRALSKAGEPPRASHRRVQRGGHAQRQARRHGCRRLLQADREPPHALRLAVDRPGGRGTPTSKTRCAAPCSPQAAMRR